LPEGTERFGAIALNERLDSLGAALSTRAGHDYTEIDLGLLSETLAEGLGLLAEVAIRPIFPDREVERVRAESLDALEARADEPANVADDRASESVFGPGHPYGRLPLGTIDGVRALRRSSLTDFHRSHYKPDGSVLIVAGDFAESQLRTLLEDAFADWSGSAPERVYPPALPRAWGAGQVSRVDWKDGTQGEIRVAGLGMARSDNDWIPGAVANFVLGGRTITGRLGSNLREDRGWTYGVRSGFAAGLILFWLHDRSDGAARTHRLVDGSLNLIVRLVRMSRLPVLGAARREMVALLDSLESD
jgi:zinc protease